MTLLAPIAGDNPAGENLQYSGLHDEIRDARREDDGLEQGDWKRDIKVADWRQVVDLATGALATRTKDLQICAWLAEALVKIDGIAGLRDGLKLMRGMHELYWEHVYPEIDEGDLEARANALVSMDGRLAVAVREIPLTSSPTGHAYSYRLWENSQKYDIPENLVGYDSDELRHFEELRQDAAHDGNITTEQWRLAKNATRRHFYEETIRLLDECWTEFHALDKVMDEKFGRETPGLGALKKQLDGVYSLVEKLVKEKRALEPDVAGPESAADETAATGVAGAEAPAVAGGAVRSRREALKQLADVAEYFRRAEPHSPISYLVQRAVKWGEMPLEAWLEEVVKNADVLGHVRETLGITVPDAG